MIISAVNVHTGGGRVLLDELLLHQRFGAVCHLFVDQRYEDKNLILEQIPTTRVAPRVFSRLLAEFQIQKLANKLPHEDLLFFGNLPPVFRLKNKTVLYLHNCFLFSSLPRPRDSIRSFIRCSIERIWFQLFLRNVDEVWVQIEWMRELTLKQFPNKKVILRPFVPTLPPLPPRAKRFDFISVNAPSKHKNLSTLLDALVLLDQELEQDIEFLLVLEGPPLSNVEELRSRLHRIRLITEYQLDRQALFERYAESRVSVVTSSLESFCLPLFESSFFGLPVIALDTPFARESRVVTDFYFENKASALCQSLKKSLNEQKSVALRSFDFSQELATASPPLF